MRRTRSTKRSSIGTVITNARILTQNARRDQIAGFLKIDPEGRIEAIGPARKTPRKTKSHRFLDAAGSILTPGFVQCHVHLCQTLFRNSADDLELMDWLGKRIWPLEASHSAASLALSARLGIFELLSSGTTTVLDMGTVRHTEAIFKVADEMGIRANIGKCLMDHPTQNPPYLREDAADALAEVEHLTARWHRQRDDRLRVSLAPRFVISCTEGLFEGIAKLSRAYGLLVHTHASENQKEIQIVREQVACENVEYLHRIGLVNRHLVLAHGIWLRPHEVDMLREGGASVVHCPGSNLKLASGVARLVDLKTHGINVALGTDGAACNNNLNAFGEMRLAALIHKPGSGPRAVRAQEAFDLATVNGARALHWDTTVGSLEVGKAADLTLIDLERVRSTPYPDPVSALVYSTGPEQVQATMVQGKWVYQTGQRARLAEKTLARQAVAASKTIERAALNLTKSYP